MKYHYERFEVVNIRNRFIVLSILILGFFAVLFVQLIQLTLVKGEEYAEKTGALDERTITVTGARGSILDRNGLPLAYDQKSYDVQFYRDPTKNSQTDRAYYTGIIIDMIKVVEQNGGETVDTFAIKYDQKTGEYYFDWGITNKKAMESRESKWRENMYVGTKRTPEEIYLYLRTKYQIPSEMGYGDARKILSIWQDVQLASWVAYKPVNVAYNVSIQTVAQIETHSAELEGMSIADSTVRIYPRNGVAAHTIGYLGRIQDDPEDPDDLKEWKDKGYSVDDLVGVEGIEQGMEEYLTGNSAERQGQRVVEVDNMAIIVNEISSTQPKQGDNVMLTIDIPLQLALEDSLAKNIPKINQDQQGIFNKNEKGKYDKIEDIDDLDLAKSGAAVVIDVDNGEILAMGSYPSFDLNLFTGGIDKEVFDELNDDKAAPLFNKAVSSRATPGSIFKMVTGLAGLMEKKITLNTIINCEDKYTKHIKAGSKAPECWTRHPENHQNQTIVEGLMHSCNYYFFTVSEKLDIDLISKWGKKFGLTDSTGIEIPGEAVGQIYEENILYDPEKSISEQKTWAPYLVKKRIVELLNGYAEVRQVEYDKDLIDKTADDLLYLAGMKWHRDEKDNNILKDERNIRMGDHVRHILSINLQISERVSWANGWSNEITSYLEQLRWAQFDTITTGIGQGVIQVTPIAVARYVAALVNGGTVFETHVVDKVVAQDGTVIIDKQPVVYDTLDAPPQYLDAIKRGMAEVVSGEDGTATERFKNFKYKDKIGGKTGTAQVSTIDLENNSWFVCFAPYDKNDPNVKPEIAVVVYVPNGYSGGLSSPVAQDIVEFYLDRKKIVAEQTMPDTNAIVEPKDIKQQTEDEEPTEDEE